MELDKLLYSLLQQGFSIFISYLLISFIIKDISSKLDDIKNLLSRVIVCPYVKLPEVKNDGGT